MLPDLHLSCLQFFFFLLLLYVIYSFVLVACLSHMIIAASRTECRRPRAR